MSADFSWDAVCSRRAALAKLIQGQLELSFGLDGGIKTRFNAPDLHSPRLEQYLADEPMWRVPFLMVGAKMNAISGAHIIDHAWWLVANDDTREPWGFVTEPYISSTDAERVIVAVNQWTEPWGVTTKLWPKAESPWYPGGTLPIVTTASPNMLGAFLRHGVGAALALLRVITYLTQ